MGDLPKGWAFVELKRLGEYINGRAFKPSEWKDNGLPIIRIQNLTNTSQKFNYSDQNHEGKYKVKNSELLVAWSASLGVFIWHGDEAWLNQHIFKVEPNYQIIRKGFLYYAIKQSINEFYQKTHGTGMVHVTKPVFESHEVPLPPLNEQTRIVEKLDKMLVKVEAAKERLDKIPGILKKYKQSVLHAAVTGELTKEWREENNFTDNIDTIIKQINERRLASAKSKKDKVKINNIYKTAEKNIFELPDEWSFKFLDKLAYSFNYGTSKKSNKEGKVPVLRMGNLQDGKINWSNLVYTDDENEIIKFLLKPNTVLFNRTNSPELVGKTSIYKGERKAIFAGYLIRINNVFELLPKLRICKKIL